MKLYNYWRSSCSFRVRIALHYKNIPFEYIPIHLVKNGGEQHRPEYASKNAMEQVPVLEVQDATGKTQLISQSVAILEYLEEVYPKPALLPKDPVQKALARKLVEIVNSGIQPFQGLKLGEYISQPGKFDRTEWIAFWNTHGLTALEKEAKKSAGKYMVGDHISLADACLVPQMYASRRVGVKTEAFPTLHKVEQLCLEHPAFQKSHPEKQIDKE